MTAMTAQAPVQDVSYARALEAAAAAVKEAGALLRDEFHRPGGARGGGGHCDADTAAEALLRRALGAAFPDFGQRGEELSRENRPARDDGGHVWLIDPNDGTSAFLKGHRGSAVSAALLRSGQPVLGVVFAYAAPDGDGDLFTWAEGCGPVTRNGQPLPAPEWPTELTAAHTVLVSQDADKNSEANAEAVGPARFRAVASIAYRLALVAAGEAVAAVSLNGPGDWDYAAGHALLRGAGGELLDSRGKPVTYTAEGVSRSGNCFGGAPAVAAELAARDWSAVFKPPAPSLQPSSRLPFDLVRPVRGETVADAGVLARAQGCLLGQFAGDALGSLVEFESAERIAREHPDGLPELFDGGHWGTLGGQPTDDSEMALMLARSLLDRRKFDEEAVAGAYAGWYGSHPYDMGFTTSQALRPAWEALRKGEGAAGAAGAAGNRESQANGALMRVSPLGVFGHAAAPEVLATWARADAGLTHPHPVCRDASAVYAVAIARAISTGEGPEAVYAFACRWAARHGVHADVLQTLEAAAVRLPKDYSAQMGWVRIALQNAFYQLLYAKTFREGVEKTVLRGGDTDTNGAIAGALLGAVHGARAVPAQWRDRVLTCRPIPYLHGVRHPRPRPFWPVDALVLAERLLVAGRGGADGAVGAVGAVGVLKG